jgi:hypothetical protein
MGFVNYLKRAAATAAGLGAVAAVSGVGIAAAAYRNHPNNPNNQTSPFAGNRSAALESAVREARS